MKNTYEFYFNKGNFICKYNNKVRTRILKNEDALMMLHRINRMNFSSFKIREKSNNDKKRLYLDMNSNSTRVSITNFRMFDELNLFDEMPHHLSSIEKAADKFTKKRYLTKNGTVKKIVATATALALITSGISFSLNKDKSIDTKEKYTISQEFEADDEVKETKEVKEDKSVEKVNYSFDNKTSSSTYEYVYDNYNDIIDKVGNERGISPSLLMGMVTQESAGLDENLMQITYSVWKDYVFKTYNYETGKHEKFVISDNPSKYDDDVKVYTLESMSDPYNNITIGSLIFRDALKKYDYNIPLAIQAYNFGYGNMSKVLDAYSEDSGKSKDSIIGDSDNIDFTKYTDVIIGQGDSEYLNNVMRYVNDDEVNIKRIDNNDVINISFKVNNNSKDKTM